jgi:hypothetical protein
VEVQQTCERYADGYAGTVIVHGALPIDPDPGIYGFSYWRLTQVNWAHDARPEPDRLPADTVVFDPEPHGGEDTSSRSTRNLHTCPPPIAV